MEIFNLKLMLISIAICTSSFFFTSCQQDALDLTDTQEMIMEEASDDHSKRIELTSENGLSKIFISVSSNDEARLQEIRSEDFKIAPIFEKPNETENHILFDENNNESEEMEVISGQVPVTFSVDKEELEEGAIGYSVDVKRKGSSGRAWEYDNWKTSHDNMWFKVTSACIYPYFYTKDYCQNSFMFKASTSLCNGWAATSTQRHSCQMYAKIRWNNSYYTWYKFKFYT